MKNNYNREIIQFDEGRIWSSSVRRRQPRPLRQDTHRGNLRERHWSLRSDHRCALGNSPNKFVLYLFVENDLTFILCLM